MREYLNDCLIGPRILVWVAVASFSVVVLLIQIGSGVGFVGGLVGVAFLFTCVYALYIRFWASAWVRCEVLSIKSHVASRKLVLSAGVVQEIYYPSVEYEFYYDGVLYHSSCYGLDEWCGSSIAKSDVSILVKDITSRDTVIAYYRLSFPEGAVIERRISGKLFAYYLMYGIIGLVIILASWYHLKTSWV